jgi:lysophospholipase L1-like esterase
MKRMHSLFLALIVILAHGISYAQSVKASTTANSVALSWTASTSAASCSTRCTFGYNIFRGTTSGAESTTPLNSSPITSTSYMDTAVTLGSSPVTYYYKVQSVETISGVTVRSSFSNEASATFPALPAAPTALSSSQDAVQSLRDFELWRESQIPVWMNDFGDLQRYASANREIGPAKAGERRVIFFGDSITDTWPLDRFFPGKGYINRGISGQTTPQMLVRFRPDVIDLGPAVVLVLAGTNDIAGNTGPMTLEQIEGNYATMGEMARLHGIQIIFASVTPVNNYVPRSIGFYLTRPRAQILALNEWLKNYCAKNGWIYLDYYSAMVDPEGMMKKELSADGLHPNADGFAVMAPLAQAAVNQALARPPLR